MSDGFFWMFIGTVIAGIGFLSIQFFGAHKAKKLIDQNNYIGLLIALLLNTIILPSFFFLLSIFGY